MLILRSPLLYVGLALVATAAALTLLDGDAAQPIVRARAEAVRAEEPVRGGVDPAVATAPKPERKRKPEAAVEKAAEKPDPTTSELGPKRRGKTSAKAADPTANEVAAPHCVVSGRCVRDGQPIAGMDFVLAPQNGKGRRQNLRTDEEGRFRRGLAGDGTFELRAVGPGLSQHQPTWTVELKDGAPCELGDLELRPRFAVRGEAKSATGQPLANVRIAMTGEDGAQVAECATDERGAFAFEDVPASPLRLDAQHEGQHGRARIRIEGKKTEWTADVVLRPRAELAWTLRDDDGRPVEGATLRSPDDDAEGVSDELGHVSMISSVSSRVRIEANGCVPMWIEVESAASARRIVLSRMRELAGKIEGADQDTVVFVGLADGAAMPHDAAREVMQKQHPIASDGTFRIEGLIAGNYTVRAAGSTGCAELRNVSLPDDPFVALTWTKGRVHTIAVRDERGEPVPFANAELTVADNQTKISLRAGHDGRFALALPDATAASLRVLRAGHLQAELRIDDGASNIDVSLQRATVLDGRVSDYDTNTPYGLHVVAWKKGQDPRSAIELAIADDGTFTSGETTPGAWNVAIRRTDRTQGGPVGGAKPLDVPLLAGGIDTRTTAVVEARGGERAQLLLPLPPIPKIDGVVTQNGRPVAGVTVFALVHGASAPGPLANHPLGFDHAQAHKRCPRAVTDRDGKFTIYASRPGSYDVRARVEGQPFSTEPMTIEVRSYADEATTAIRLPTAVVRGRLATASKTSLAFLVPTTDAARDPFRADDGPADVACREGQRMQEDGVFEFPCVAKGVYVARFLAGGRIVRQCLVHVGDEPVDLGEVPEAPMAKPASIALPTAAPKGATAVALQLLPEVEGGAFCKRLPTDGDKLMLRELPAGNYRIRVFDGPNPVGEAFDVTLRGDGTAMQIASTAKR
jgi:hypothetical protein